MKDPHAAAVFDFVDRFYADLDAGTRQPLSTYLPRYPGHEDAIAREYVSIMDALVEPAKEASEASDDETYVGPYRILRELGRGGQGQVFLAEDTRIARKAAIKMLPGGIVAESRRNRLRREAEAIARLDHPGICGIQEALIEGDQPYIAMQFVEGETLAQQLREARRDVVPWRPTTRSELHAVLRVFERTARALHAAHEEGIVHRDIKPANLMITPDGHPVLLDFGLAWQEDAEVHLTMTGEAFGTLEYMSPEQLRGQGEVDHRTDVYSLGVTLYEALTGERLIQQENRVELMREVLGPKRNASGAVSALFGGELETVLQVAHGAVVGDRYESALVFAEDLRRIREYEPIKAAQAGAGLRLRRWIRREPGWAAATLGAAVALVIGLAVTLVLLKDARRAQRNEAARLDGTRSSELAAKDPAKALAKAVQGCLVEPDYSARSLLFPLLENDVLDQVIQAPNTPAVMCAAVHPGLEHVAVAYRGGRVEGWALGDRDLRWSLQTESDGWAGLEWSSSEHLVAVNNAGMLFDIGVSWDEPAPRAEVRKAAVQTPAPLAIATSPLNDLLALTGADFVQVQRASTHEVLLDVTVPRTTHPFVRVFPDGLRVLRGVRSPRPRKMPADPICTAQVLDLSSAQIVASVGDTETALAWTGLSPRGEVVTGCDRGFLRFWDVETAEESRPAINVGGRIACVDFHPVEDLIAVGTAENRDSGLWLVDLEGAQSHRLQRHMAASFTDVAFDPTGERLASCARDQATILWDVESKSAVRELRSQYLPGEAIWASGGNRLVTIQPHHHCLHVWRTGANPFVYALPSERPLTCARFDTRGESVVTGDADGIVARWLTPSEAALEPGKFDRVLLRLMKPIAGTSTLGPDGMVAWTDDTVSAVFGAARMDTLECRLQPEGGVAEVAAATDTARCLVRSGQGTLHAFNGQEWATVPIESELVSCHLAKTGTRASLVWAGGEVVIVDWPWGSSIDLVRARTIESGNDKPSYVRDLAFNADGSRLATTWGRLSARVYDSFTTEQLYRTRRLFELAELSFVTGTEHLFLLGEGGPLSGCTWDLVRAKRGEAFNLHFGALTAGTTSASGEWVATGSQGGSVVVWRLDAAAPFAYDSGRRVAVEHLEFDPGPGAGRVLVLYEDGIARIMPRDPIWNASSWVPRSLRDWDPASEQALVPLRMRSGRR